MSEPISNRRIETIKAWRRNNPDKVAAISKRYHQRHPEVLRNYEAKNREKRNAKQRERYHQRVKEGSYRKEHYRNMKLKAHYGITAEQYDAMFSEQKGLCFICGNPPKEGRRLAVDHDHVTGKVRKLLCWHCNRRMESIDDAVWMERGLEYKKIHEQN